MRRGAAVLLGACLLLIAAGAVDPEETLRSPASIAWRIGLPAAAALLLAAFLALPASGRLALGSAVAALTVVEAGSFGLHWFWRPHVETWIEPEYYQDHASFGYGPKPGISTRAWKRVDGRSVYDVRYSIDERG